MAKNVRWKQRYSNFEKSFKMLQETTKIGKPSDAERVGLIQFFEVTFELAWKTLKDYLESQGYNVKTPRETLKQAFEIELIIDGEQWLEALDDRNLTTHTYDEKMAKKVEKLIREKYNPLLIQLHQNLSTLISKP